MAETSGLVQRIHIASSTLTCVWIGPAPNNAELLTISAGSTAADTAFAYGMIQTLSAAATNYRQVVAVHGDSSNKITSIRIESV